MPLLTHNSVPKQTYWAKFCFNPWILHQEMAIFSTTVERIKFVNPGHTVLTLLFSIIPRQLTKWLSYKLNCKYSSKLTSPSFLSLRTLLRKWWELINSYCLGRCWLSKLFLIDDAFEFQYKLKFNKNFNRKSLIPVFSTLYFWWKKDILKYSREFLQLWQRNDGIMSRSGKSWHWKMAEPAIFFVLSAGPWMSLS